MAIHREDINKMAENKIRIWFKDKSYTIIRSIQEINNYNNVVYFEYLN